MYEEFKDILGLSPEENKRAVEAGYRALQFFDNVTMRGEARKVLEQLEREDRLGVVLLGRPYHNDPGVNHEILEEFQKLGYPVFAQDCLPIDDDIIWRLFGPEVEAGECAGPLAINDVWKNSYSENTSRKVWAAKYVARHPNLVALELSSFKCGHDAPIYSVVEEIVEHSGTPYFCFKDIDENKPTGSIRIRVETIGYFLKRYREDMVRNKQKTNNIDQQLKEFEAKLRRQMLRDRMDDSRVQESFEHGSMPQIHVSIGALAASNPPACAGQRGLSGFVVGRRKRLPHTGIYFAIPCDLFSSLCCLSGWLPRVPWLWTIRASASFPLSSIRTRRRRSTSTISIA